MATMAPRSAARPQPAGTSVLAFAAGALVTAALLLAYYKLTWDNLTAFNLAIDVWADPFPDFGRYYYPMGVALFRTGMPVEGFVYSPFVAILLAAFSPLELSTATTLWVALQVLAIVLYVLLIRRLVPARLPLQLFFVALTLSSFPLLHNFKFGQVPVFTTVALLGMLVCYERGWKPAAAVLFAFAVSFKWYPLIFLALFVARRDWRFLLWAAGACAMLIVVVPAALLGFEQTLSFYDALRAAYGGFGWTATSYNSQYFPHVIIRLVRTLWGPAPSGVPFLRAYGLPVLQAISWCVVLANVALVYRVQRLGLRHANLWSAVALFLSVPFMLGTSWPVDLVPLSFAQAFLAWAILNKDETTLLPGDPQPEGRPRPVTLRPTVAGAMVSLSMLLSNILLFNYIGDRMTYGTFGCVFWADALLLVALYLLLAPHIMRHSRTPQPVPQTDSAHARAA